MTALPRILTVGHSTRPLDELLALLQGYGVRLLVDVRTVPRSRRNPQYAQETLAAALATVGIGYHHCLALGGWRRPRPDSPNTAWQNMSFRGFADYMQTEAFAEALEHLLALATEAGRLTLLCAEAVPWRCHRSLIADALLASGEPVAHILAAGRIQPHRLTPFARLVDGRVIYPASDDRFLP